MRQRTKKPPNAIAPTCAARVARRTIGRRSAQRLSGIGETGELGILTQACKDTNAGISDDKLKCAFARSICDDAGLAPPAVLNHIFLELAQRPHQPRHQSPRKPISSRGIFNMTGPLIPQNIGVRFRVVVHQREHARSISGARAGYSGLRDTFANLREERRRLSHAGIGSRQCRCGKSQLNKGSNPSRPFDHELATPLETSLPRLPKKIIDNVECGQKSMCRSKTQECPSPPHSYPSVPKHGRASSCSPCRLVLRNRNYVNTLSFLPRIEPAAPEEKATVR